MQMKSPRTQPSTDDTDDDHIEPYPAFTLSDTLDVTGANADHALLLDFIQMMEEEDPLTLMRAVSTQKPDYIQTYEVLRQTDEFVTIRIKPADWGSWKDTLRDEAAWPDEVFAEAIRDAQDAMQDTVPDARFPNSYALTLALTDELIESLPDPEDAEFTDDFTHPASGSDAA